MNISEGLPSPQEKNPGEKGRDGRAALRRWVDGPPGSMPTAEARRYLEESPADHPNWNGPEMTRLREIGETLAQLGLEKDALFNELGSDFPPEDMDAEVRDAQDRLDGASAEMRDSEREDPSLYHMNPKYIRAKGDVRYWQEEIERRRESSKENRAKFARLEELREERQRLKEEGDRLRQSPAIRAIFEDSKRPD